MRWKRLYLAGNSAARLDMGALVQAVCRTHAG